MNGKTIGMVLGATVLGIALVGAGYGPSQAGAQNPTHASKAQVKDRDREESPAYTASIQVKDQDREERGERREERGEGSQLASLAKIDIAQAASAALAKVPGTVLKAGLDNENGNLVYSVEVKTASSEIKDVKVDAGNGTVLHVDGRGQDEGENE